MYDGSGENRHLLIAGNTTHIVQLSLDKLTIVGDFIYPERGLNTLSQLPDTTEDRLAKFPYRYNINTISKTVIQLADKDAPVPNVRLSWNPTDLLQDNSARQILPLLKNKRPTRIDYALDYPLDLSGWIFATTQARKTSRICSPSGKLETLYIGSRESEHMYRIYDKAKEMRQSDGVTDSLTPTPDHLWRIELELKPKKTDWQFYLPFNDLYVVHPNLHLDIVDRVILDALRKEPELMGQLSRRIKEKYRQMIKENVLLTRLHPWPQDAFLTRAQSIYDQITSYLKQPNLQPF